MGTLCVPIFVLGAILLRADMHVHTGAGVTCMGAAQGAWQRRLTIEQGQPPRQGKARAPFDGMHAAWPSRGMATRCKG
jgi:acetamidase/formamidase